MVRLLTFSAATVIRYFRDRMRYNVGMRIEDVTPETVRPVRRPWLVQRWHDLAFLHWPVDPAVVAPLLPPGTRRTPWTASPTSG